MTAPRIKFRYRPRVTFTTRAFLALVGMAAVFVAVSLAVPAARLIPSVPSPVMLLIVTVSDVTHDSI